MNNNILNKIRFLTSNQNKAKDFSICNFEITHYESDIPEIYTESVELVALYKAFHTNLNNIIVEDTALYIENSPFLGTEIKHTYNHIKDNDSYNNKKATWKVAVCCRIDDNYYISSDTLSGTLKYPVCEKGYHFETLLHVNCHNKNQFYAEYNQEEKFLINPRFKAIKKLQHAILNNDFSQITIIKADNVLAWEGKYQEEDIVNINNRKRKPLL